MLTGTRCQFAPVRFGALTLTTPQITPTGLTTPSGERRQVTALFADMVGFTAISERWARKARSR